MPAEADAERRSNIINEILDQLKPGTSAAIYWLPKNEKKDENAEAIKNKKEYVVKEIPTSDKFDYVHVVYRGAKGGITVEVRQAELGAKTGSNATGVEKVMLGKNEAVLMTYKEDNQPDFHWIVWIKNGSDLEYSVRAKDTAVSKEELIKLAKQLNEHK